MCRRASLFPWLHEAATDGCWQGEFYQHSLLSFYFTFSWGVTNYAAAELCFYTPLVKNVPLRSEPVPEVYFGFLEQVTSSVSYKKGGSEMKWDESRIKGWVWGWGGGGGGAMAKWRCSAVLLISHGDMRNDTFLSWKAQLFHFSFFLMGPNQTRARNQQFWQNCVCGAIITALQRWTISYGTCYTGSVGLRSPSAPSALLG